MTTELYHLHFCITQNPIPFKLNYKTDKISFTISIHFTILHSLSPQNTAQNVTVSSVEQQLDNATSIFLLNCIEPAKQQAAICTSKHVRFL